MSNVDRTSSPFYAWLDHARIRRLVDEALELSPGERLVVLKGLIPGLVDALGLHQMESVLGELVVKARRYDEAVHHPGEGRRTRTEPGEPIGGPTPGGHVHIPAVRNPETPGSRHAERLLEAFMWEDVPGVGARPSGEPPAGGSSSGGRQGAGR